MTSALIHLSEESVATLATVKAISLSNKNKISHRNSEIELSLRLLQKFIDKLDSEDFENITGLKK